MVCQLLDNYFKQMNYEQNESETKIPAIYIITAVNFAIITFFVARKYLIATKKET